MRKRKRAACGCFKGTEKEEKIDGGRLLPSSETWEIIAQTLTNACIKLETLV